MNRRRVIGILGLFGLAACTGAPVQPTVPPDPLASLIVQSGDLPITYHTRNDPMPWRIYPGIPITPLVYYYEIIGGNDEANEVGHITVVRYNTAADTDSAYAAIQSEAEFQKQVQPLAIGEGGSQSGPSADWKGSDVLFRRCNTVVHISLEGDTLGQLVAYAQKLNDRIWPVIC